MEVFSSLSLSMELGRSAFCIVYSLSALVFASWAYVRLSIIIVVVEWVSPSVTVSIVLFVGTTCLFVGG